MTKIQELLKLESDLTQMFDSDQRVAMALLQFIRENRSSLLENDTHTIAKRKGRKPKEK